MRDALGDVAVPTIAVTPASIPGATTNVAYSQSLSAGGGTGPYSYAVTSGALPSGISLSGSGMLSGAAATSGSFTFTVTATDANNNSGTQAYTLAISSPTIALNPTTGQAGCGSKTSKSSYQGQTLQQQTLFISEMIPEVPDFWRFFKSHPTMGFFLKPLEN